MKKQYTNPTIEVIVLNAKDCFMSTSGDGTFGEPLAGDTETNYNTLG